MVRYFKIAATLFLLAVLCISESKSVTLKDSRVQMEMAASISNSSQFMPLAAGFGADQSFENASEPEKSRKVSLFKAGIYSALLPGLGEYYVGHKSKARIFFAAEAATWISFFSFHLYGNLKEEDFIDYAAINANASLDGKSKEFQDWVGFYEDIDQFNTLGRVQDPERPYLVDNAENHWRWQSPYEQETFRNLKNKSRDAFRKRDFMIGLAIANRVVSIFDAVRDAKRAKREIKEDEFSILSGIKYRVEIDPFERELPLSMALYKKF